MFPALALRALSSALGGAWLAASPIIVVPAGSARTACPSPAALEAALSARFPGAVRPAESEPGPGQLRLTTALAPGTLRLEVRSERGDLLLRRVLPRDEHDHDCRSLAESVALIVDRYVHALVTEPGVPLPPAPTPAPATPPASVPTPSPPAAVASPILPVPDKPTPPTPAPVAVPAPPPPAAPAPPPEPLLPVPVPVRPVERQVPRPEASLPPRAPGPPAGSIVEVWAGERFGNGSPTSGTEGRLVLDRLSHWQGAGWLMQWQLGLAKAGEHVDDTVGTLRLWRVPVRLALGLTRPLGFGQLETSLGVGGDLLLRSWSPPSAATTHDVRFVPLLEGSAGFRAFLSERLSLSLGVSIGWALVRYDLGLATTNGQSATLFQTPRLNVTPGLGLGVRFM